MSEIIVYTTGSSSGETLCVEIPIINDTDVECDDVFNVTITSNLSKVIIPSDSEYASVTIDLDPSDGAFIN